MELRHRVVKRAARVPERDRKLSDKVISAWPFSGGWPSVESREEKYL